MDADDPETENLLGDPEIDKAMHLLPAWFVPRMMCDHWNFAFLMVTGDYVHLTHINRVHLGADGIWIDVELNDSPGLMDQKDPRHFCAQNDRLTASINARHIVMAFETADT